MNEYGSKQLVRSSSDKLLGGVCGGLSNYFGVDATIVRLVMAAVVLFTGVGPFAYILAWVLMPTDSGKAIADGLGKKATDWYQTQQAKRPTNTTTYDVNGNAQNPGDFR